MTIEPSSRNRLSNRSLAVVATALVGAEGALPMISRSTFDADPPFEITGLVPGEYVIGVSKFGSSLPLTELVHQGAVHGWKVVDLPRGDVHALELEITEGLASELKLERARNRR